MKKQYKLLVETAEYSIGTEARWNSSKEMYVIFINGEEVSELYANQVEDRHSVWELIEEEEKVDNEYLPFFPVLGQKYWFISSTGKVESDTVCGHPVDTFRVTNSVVFRTEQAAKYEAYRRESMSRRYLPEEGAIYYWYDFCTKRCREDMYEKDTIDSYNYLIGNCHKSEEGCTQWAEKYSTAWEVLL